MPASARPTVLAARELAKSWPGGGGLAPITFDVRAGDLTVVRGRSGSGKSTLLALVAGWCEPDRGELELPAGRDWSRCAVLPQVIGLAPELSVRENVELPLRLGHVPRAERRDRTLALLDALELGEVADRRPADTSMGQRQRAALARALVTRPDLVLVDEPTSHQDAAHTASIVAVLLDAVRAGSALLVATHDPDVVAVATRVVDLDAA